MLPIKKEMSEWLNGLCDNDQRIIDKIRRLLIENKPLLRAINIDFQNGNTQLIKDSIESFLESKNIYITNCKYCRRKEVFNSLSIESHVCTKCVKEITVNPQHNRKKCLYCDSPVMSIENALTCYNCTNINFNVYE